MSDSTPPGSKETSLTFRSRDPWLYAAFGCYVAASVVLVALSYGSIDAYVALGFIFPTAALISLICFQAGALPRPSPLAFCLVLAGVLASAFVLLSIAAAAAAAV